MSILTCLRQEPHRLRDLFLGCGNIFAAFAPPPLVTPEEINEMVGILDETVAVARHKFLRTKR